MRVIRTFLIALFLCFSLPLMAEQQPGTVNINTADKATLVDKLKGVGPSKADAIIAYRQNYGPFQTVDELVAVKGIGEKFIAKNRQHIVLE